MPASSSSHGPPPDWDALARYLAGESPAEEVEVVRRWLAERPADAEVVASLDRTLDGWATASAPEVDIDAALARVTARLDETVRDAPVIPIDRPRPRLERIAPTTPAAWWTSGVMRAAAVLAIVTTGALVWASLRRERSQAGVVAARTIATPVGVRDSVHLPDGSRVILAPGSRLVVNAGYGNPDRMVELEGEGWFDVKHDDAHAFTVRAGAAAVRDVGTTFTVRAERGAAVRVAVSSGAVLLGAVAKPSEQGLVLHQGDVGTLENDGRLVAERGRVTDDDVAWTKGELVFREAPLDDVGATLARWYGIHLRVDDAVLASRHVTTTFQQGESASRVLDVLGLVLGAEIERRGDTAVVRARPSRP